MDPDVAEALTQIQAILRQIASSMQVIADNEAIMNSMQASTNRILTQYVALLERLTQEARSSQGIPGDL